MSEASIVPLLLSFSFGLSIPVAWWTCNWIKSKYDALTNAVWANAFATTCSTVANVLGFAAMAVENCSTRDQLAHRLTAHGLKLDDLSRHVQKLKLDALLHPYRPITPDHDDEKVEVPSFAVGVPE